MLCSGIAAGLLLGGLLPLPSPAPPRARPAQPEALTARRCAGDDPGLEAAFAALTAADERLQSLRASVEGAIGQPLSFDEIPEVFRPDRVEETLLDALEDTELSLQWIDCSEAPCIAVLQLPEELWIDRSFVLTGDLLREQLGTGHPWEAFGAGGGHFMTLPLLEGGWDQRRYQRIDLREEFIIGEIAHGRLR